MKKKRELLFNINIWLSIIIIFIFSYAQPYLVIGNTFGPSANCFNCLIIEEIFISTFVYLILPISFVHIILQYFKLNSILTSFIIGILFGFMSFLTISVPLFDTRIAAWSTYTNGELYLSCFIASFPALLVMMIFLSLTLLLVNSKIRKD